MTKNRFRIFLLDDYRQSIFSLIIICMLMLGVVKFIFLGQTESICIVNPILMFGFFIINVFKGKVDSLTVLIQLGCTRKQYYLNRIKYSFIVTFILSIFSISVNWFCFINEIKFARANYNTFLIYFLYYFMCCSIKTFTRILSKSAYIAVEYGTMFFLIILYMGTGGGIVFSSMSMINEDLFVYITSFIVIIIFTLTMSYIALNTVEIES